MTEAVRTLMEERLARDGWMGLLAAWGQVLRDLATPLPEIPDAGSGREPPEGRMAGGRRRWTAWWEDLVFAWRSLGREPRFTGALVVVLGLGMALNAAVFSVVNAYLLRPLPYPAADRIVQIRPITDLSWTEVDDYLERAVSWDLDVFTLLGEDGPLMVRGSWITPDFLDVYGVRAALGRAFRPDEAGQGGPPVAMISHRLWRDRFRGDPDIVGRTFEAFTSDRPDHAESFTIVGVLPADFWHVNEFTDVLAPLRDERAVYVGRLRPDVPLAVAEAGLTELARSTTAALPPDFSITLTRLQEGWASGVRPILAVLQGAVILVLLIACANAGVLLLVRSTRRSRELGVRGALGASRARLARQLGFEGLLLALAGGVAGLLGASLLVGLAGTGVEGTLGQSVPGGAEGLGLDGTVVLATAATCLTVGLLFGLVAAGLLLGSETRSALWGGSRGGGESRGRRRLRNAFVVAQVALSMALLSGAALMIRSAVHLNRLDLGFDAQRLTRATLGLRQASYPRPDERISFFEGVLDGVRGLASVEAAALTSSSPFTGIVNPSELEGETAAGGAASRARATVSSVGGGYFAAMGIRLLRGRDVGPDDREGAEPVAVVSESVAARLWPGRDPLGRRLRLVPEPGVIGAGDAPGAWHTVVGLVEDVTRDLRVDADGQVYASYRQDAGYWMALVIRRRPGSPPPTEAVRGVVHVLDRDVPLSDVAELSDLVAAARTPTSFTAGLLGGFSALALLLAVVGLYGVVAYAARQRRRDVAIRMALGADAGSVTGLFLRQGLAVVAMGVAVGSVGGLLLGRTLAGQLRGVTPNDPVTHGAVAMGLLVTAYLAVWWPSHQAATRPPMGILRED